MVKVTALGGSRSSRKLFAKFPILVDELFAFQRVRTAYCVLRIAYRVRLALMPNGLRG